MRTFALLAALVTSAVATAAAGAAQPTTSLSASQPQVGYRQAVTLAGRLSDRASGVAVTLDARPFNAARLTTIATVRTNGTGRWTYVARPSIATTYEASVGGKTGPSLMIHVRPALSLQVAPAGTVVAHVSPSSLHGRFVQLQRLASPNHWSTLAKQPLGRSGEAVFSAATLPAGAAHLRIVMSVNQAGAGYLGGFSEPVVYPAHTISLAKTPLQVGYGDSLQLSGRISLKQSGVPLQILARPFMRESFQQVATIHTSAGGKWGYRVTPPFTTSYVARWGNGQTRVLTVGVRPAMSIQVLSGDRISAHVGLAKSVTGKAVELQQRQADGSWKTVATLKLDAKATAVFKPALTPPGTSTLRMAISVNQVGAGSLGGFSRPIVYHR